jgi:hypothetical protein
LVGDKVAAWTQAHDKRRPATEKHFKVEDEDRLSRQDLFTKQIAIITHNAFLGKYRDL